MSSEAVAAPHAAEGSRGPLVVAVGFALVGVVAIFSGRFIDDEGYLTWISARLLDDSFLATLFFLKFHPTLVVLYGLPALLGFRGFLVCHVLFAASGVYLTGRLARRFGAHATVASL